MTKLLVVLDVDSTLIEQEVIDLLGAKVGLGQQIREITDQAMSGEIDFSQALIKRVALLKGLTSKVFQEIVSEITVTDGVEELIGFVHESGGLVGAISGGFKQTLEPLAKNIGLDLFLANDLEVIDGVLSGKVNGDLVDSKMKAATMLGWAHQYGIDVANTVAIGDGANDIPMLQAAGFSVAFRPKDILRPYADLIVEGNSLRPVVAELELRSS